MKGNDVGVTKREERRRRVKRRNKKMSERRQGEIPKIGALVVAHILMGPMEFFVSIEGRRAIESPPRIEFPEGEDILVAAPDQHLGSHPFEGSKPLPRALWC